MNAVNTNVFDVDRLKKPVSFVRVYHQPPPVSLVDIHCTAFRRRILDYSGRGLEDVEPVLRCSFAAA